MAVGEFRMEVEESSPPKLPFLVDRPLIWVGAKAGGGQEEVGGNPNPDPITESLGIVIGMPGGPQIPKLALTGRIGPVVEGAVGVAVARGGVGVTGIWPGCGGAGRSASRRAAVVVVRSSSTVLRL